MMFLQLHFLLFNFCVNLTLGIHNRNTKQGTFKIKDRDIIKQARLKAMEGKCDSAEDAIHYRKVFRRPLGYRPFRLPCQVEPGQCDRGLESLHHEEIIIVRGEKKRLVVTNGIPNHYYANFTGTER